MTVTKKAAKYYDQFETIKKSKSTIVALKDTASKKLHDSVRNAHREMMPNDWIFATYRDILGRIGDYNECKTLDDLEDIRAEIVDSMVDVYTGNLTEWLASNVTWVEYIDRALEELDTKEGWNFLSLAQYLAIDDIFSEIVTLLGN